MNNLTTILQDEIAQSSAQCFCGPMVPGSNPGMAISKLRKQIVFNATDDGGRQTYHGVVVDKFLQLANYINRC